MLDADRVELYQVPTKRLNEAVRRTAQNRVLLVCGTVIVPATKRSIPNRLQSQYSISKWSS
jgi:hypothetical protein